MGLAETFKPKSEFGKGMLLVTAAGLSSAGVSDNAEAAMIIGNGTVTGSAVASGQPFIQNGDNFDFSVDFGNNSQFVDLFPSDPDFASYLIEGVDATFQIGSETLTVDDATITASSNFNGSGFSGLLNFNAGNVQGDINGLAVSSVLLSTTNANNSSAEELFNNLATGTFSISGDQVLVQGVNNSSTFDPAAVPVPPAAALFGTALVGLGVFSRRLSNG